MENEFEFLLRQFIKLKIKELPATTFLEIVNKSHLENVWSRILAFYFNPNNGHHLYELLIRSLLDVLEEKNTILHSFHSYDVLLEYKTPKNNRIDIVIVTKEFVIGIENKINSPLYNDLPDYSNAIDILAKKRKSYKIILSKFKNDESQGFRNITYDKFIGSIKQHIGHYYSFADTKYFIFLLDFIDNIEKNLNSIYMIKDQELMKYFIDNAEVIQKLVKKENQVRDELWICLNNLQKFLLNDKLFNDEFQAILSLGLFSLDFQYINFLEGLVGFIKIKDQNIIRFDICIDKYTLVVDSYPEEKYASIFTGWKEYEDNAYQEIPSWTDLETKVKKIIFYWAYFIKNNERKVLDINLI